MASTLLGNNIFTDTARMQTSGTYMSAAAQQSAAANASSSNALSVAGILQQPFFGASGGISGIWSKVSPYLIPAGIIFAVVKWVLPMFGIRILWGKGGARRASSGRRNILARARAAKRRKRSL